MTLRFYMLRIMPVGLFMALTLHFGNTVYLYLTVSFIQMLKVTPYSLSLSCSPQAAPKSLELEDQFLVVSHVAIGCMKKVTCAPVSNPLL